MKKGPLYSRRICLSTNTNCNLRCIYCYEKCQDNTEFNVVETSMVLKQLLCSETEFGTKIKLHGGEPFLVFHKIKELCETIWKEDINEYYHFHITTNGTLIHGGIQEWLYQNRDKITLKLSLDGNKNSSDINRPRSFDLIDFPFFIKTWPDIIVNMTITPQTALLVSNNVRFIHSLGFRNILSHFSLLTDWSKLSELSAFYEQLLDIAEFYLESSNVEPWYFFDYDIAYTLEDKMYCTACNLGQMTAYDFQTKKYYPCQMCFPSVFGKKKSDELLKIDFTNFEQLEGAKCLQCPFINICHTCYAENYLARGNVSSRDMSLCKCYKLIFVALFKYEYARIMNLKDPTPGDMRKMLAIKTHYKVIREIEKSVRNGNLVP